MQAFHRPRRTIRGFVHSLGVFRFALACSLVSLDVLFLPLLQPQLLGLAKLVAFFTVAIAIL